MSRINGKVAVVTGAARGIGRAIALRLTADGADLAINDVNAEGAEKLAEEVSALARRSVAIAADVSDRDAVFGLVERVASEFGSVDVFVNDAGIAQVKLLLETNPEDLEALFRVDVFGVVYGIRGADAPAGDGRDDHQRRVDRRPLRLRVPGPVLRDHVRRRRPDPGGGQGARRRQDHGQLLLPGIVGTNMWNLIDEKLRCLSGPRQGPGARAACGRDPPRPGPDARRCGRVRLLPGGPDSDYMTGRFVLVEGGLVMR
jgi:meso-butanediol dehydrogenase / (S,S)-butanediol dehydrogenase / diacetyl reductase